MASVGPRRAGKSNVKTRTLQKPKRAAPPLSFQRFKAPPPAEVEWFLWFGQKNQKTSRLSLEVPREFLHTFLSLEV